MRGNRSCTRTITGNVYTWLLNRSTFPYSTTSLFCFLNQSSALPASWSLTLSFWSIRQKLLAGSRLAMAAHEEAYLKGSEIVSDSTEHANAAQDDSQTPDRTAQSSVLNIEATTVAWTTTALIFSYVMLWIIYFFEGMLSGVTAALNPFVTSAFAQHSLTPPISALQKYLMFLADLRATSSASPSPRWDSS